MCKNTSNSNRRDRPEREREKSESAAAKVNEKDLESTIKNITEQTAEAIKAANKDGKGTDFSKFGEEMARRLNNRKKGGGGRTSGKSVTVVPFVQDQQDPVAAKFAQTAFSTCYGQLVVARPSEASIATLQPGTQDDAALIRVAKEAGATFVLSATTTRPAEGAPQLAVRLLQSADGTVAWQSDFPIVASEAAPTGGKIAEAVLAHMPPRPPEIPGRPPPRPQPPP
jgi:TolB-like protein